MPTIDAGDKKLRKVIQVGKKGRLRVISSNSDPVVLPKRLGKHTGIRAWLANLELSYIVWKLDSLYKKITNLADPYNCLDPILAKKLDALTVEAYLIENTRFKSVQDVLEIQIRFLTGADLNRISLQKCLKFCRRVVLMHSRKKVQKHHFYQHCVMQNPSRSCLVPKFIDKKCN